MKVSQSTRSKPLVIRPLTVEELPLCDAHGRAFHAEKGIPGEFSLDVFCRNWEAFLAHYHGIILGLWDEEQLVGGLGGIIAPDLTGIHRDTGLPVLTATEFFLFVEPAYRGYPWWLHLIEQFRAHGAARGASRLRMVTMILPGSTLDRQAKILAWKYQKLGLRPIELCFDGPIEAPLARK